VVVGKNGVANETCGESLWFVRTKWLSGKQWIGVVLSFSKLGKTVFVVFWYSRFQNPGIAIFQSHNSGKQVRLMVSEISIKSSISEFKNVVSLAVQVVHQS
jgi:hypothetical protein